MAEMYRKILFDRKMRCAKKVNVDSFRISINHLCNNSGDISIFSMVVVALREI